MLVKRIVLSVCFFTVLLSSCHKNNDLDVEESMRPSAEIIIPDDVVNVRDYGATGDGITSDCNAVKKALAVAQEQGVYLYFPEGTYNLEQWNHAPGTEYSNASVRVDNDLKIIGDGPDKSTITNAGNFWCTKGIFIKHLNIKCNTLIFLNLDYSQGTYVDMDLNNIVFSSDRPGFVRFCDYNKQPASGRGFENLNVSNCHFSRIRFGLRIICDIKKGYIGYNTFRQMGDLNIRQEMGAIYLGGITTTTLDGGKARNMLIEHNEIKDVYVGGKDKGGPAYEVYALPVFVCGQDVVIRNNRIENLNGAYEHEGIYIKAGNTRILNNTLINAGDEEGAICAKGGSYVWVEGNTIISTTPPNPKKPDTVGYQGIMLMCDYVTVKNNNIDVSWGTGIKLYTGQKKSVVVESNIVKTGSYSGISVENLVGRADILNNQVVVKESLRNAFYAGIFMQKLGLEAQVNIRDNTVQTENCMALSINGFSSEGNFITAHINGNTFETKSVPWKSTPVTNISNIHWFDFSDNDVRQTYNADYTGETGPLIAVSFLRGAQTRPEKQEIHQNRLFYGGNTSSGGIKLLTDVVDVRDNEITLDNDHMVGLVWWIAQNDQPERTAVISGNRVNGSGKTASFLCIDTGVPVQLGILEVSNNSFNMTDYMLRKYSSWNNKLIAQEIKILNNKVGTKKAADKMVIYPDHIKEVKFTLSGNEAFVDGI